MKDENKPQINLDTVQQETNPGREEHKDPQTPPENPKRTRTNFGNSDRPKLHCFIIILKKSLFFGVSNILEYLIPLSILIDILPH